MLFKSSLDPGAVALFTIITCLEASATFYEKSRPFCKVLTNSRKPGLLFISNIKLDVGSALGTNFRSSDEVINFALYIYKMILPINRIIIPCTLVLKTTIIIFHTKPVFCTTSTVFAFG